MTAREKMLNRLTGFDPHMFHGCGVAKRGDYCPSGSMVYFLYTRIGGHMCLVYVGQTHRGYRRIEEHILYKKIPVDQWYYIPVPSSMLNEVERYYIQTYRPILNLVDNPDFIRDDGHYTRSKEDWHDIQRRRIVRLNTIKEMEEQTGQGATDLYTMLVDEDGSDFACINIMP